MYESIKFACIETGKKRGIETNWNLIQATKPVICDSKLNSLLEGAIKDSAYETVKLVSGAGHDAAAISEVAPVSMMFVRCYKGISHNPLENTELKDIEAAVKVANMFLKEIIDNYSQTEKVRL